MRPLNLGELSPKLADTVIPILPYSYSSKGFPDIWERFKRFRDVNPIYLVSLYDVTYHLSWELFTAREAKVRIWDSGGFETSPEDDKSGAYPLTPGSYPWSRSLYIQAAKQIPWNDRDILVNFDDNSRQQDINLQIASAQELFSLIPGRYMRDLLVHVPFDVDPEWLAAQIAPHAKHLHILGLTEKEIAPTWVHGVRFLSKFRRALNEKAGKYIPIHIFGCLDPKAISRLTLAGADIFDGLTWQRYFVSGGQALYKHEAQYVIEPSLLQDQSNLEPWILSQNISALEKHRADLAYAIGADDFKAFEQECGDIDYALKHFPARRDNGW